MRPLELLRESKDVMLLLESPRGKPLDHFVGRPVETGLFLGLALDLSAALRRLHERALVHRDIRPANVLVDVASQQVRLMGFGNASPIPRERQLPKPRESIAGIFPFRLGQVRSVPSGIPYATLAQAFQGLVREILSKSEAQLREWRIAFLKALGPNGADSTALR